MDAVVYTLGALAGLGLFACSLLFNRNRKIFYMVLVLSILLTVSAIVLHWQPDAKVVDLQPEPQPDTQVLLFGQEHSYTIGQLKEEAPIRSKITISPVRFPEGVPEVTDQEIPLKFFNWDFPEGTKLYTIVAQNKGDGIDNNIMIDIDFATNPIVSLEIDNKDRVSIIRGGKIGASRAVFEIDELLPNELQSIEIIVEGTELGNLTAWSEKLLDIEKIYIFDVIIEPDTEYLPQLTIIEGYWLVQPFQANIIVTVQSSGKSEVKYGEVLVEWYDSIDNKNKSSVIVFENLDVGEIESGNTTCSFDFTKDGDFYYNLNIQNIR